ncbi:tripartite tricarboxylate transporter TctB family protein [Mitsuaria sp. GD03876]|uniref:tripartite tricarboxylate transporter TctB family protein n=1 Tax=Mitsuaria sp. GD03876 TaxID=2975399 RepID=UPI00244BBC9D|nr:tripartite tricarboxylate transporter TctB family protein [Mitsuaria sp. GD03876]MDH0865254.1 tripartite tricarboxylate transporter TctB family protein [Mitsuaria sp. GD03876]
MKIKSQRDFWSGLMFVVVGVAFACGSIINYSFGTSARPGPGYFPFGLGILLALLGAVVLFKALTIESEGGQPVGAFAWKPLLIVVGSIVLFGFALPRLGMIITLPLLITCASMASDEFKWRDALLSSVVLTAGSYAIFIWGLNLVIPIWPTFLGG